MDGKLCIYGGIECRTAPCTEAQGVPCCIECLRLIGTCTSACAIAKAKVRGGADDGR